MLRIAQEKDIETIFQFGSLFLASGYNRFPVDTAHAMGYLKAFIVDPNNIGLIVDVDNVSIGCFLGQSCQHPFSPFKIANEIFWWVEPKNRGRISLELFDAFEYWAVNKMHCDVVCMSQHPEDTRIDKLYKKRNYKLASTNWCRSFNKEVEF